MVWLLDQWANSLRILILPRAFRFNRSGFNSPKLASFLIHKVYIKCLGACPEDLYFIANALSGTATMGSSTFSVVHCGGDVEFTDGEVEHGD